MISTLVSLTFLQQITHAYHSTTTTTPTSTTQAITTASDPYHLGCCITDCHGRPDGDYQSCYGCEYYATCAGGEMTSANPTISFWDRRPCGAPGIGLKFDDNTKRCEWDSDTCDPERGICNEKCESNLPEHFPAQEGCAPICETADYLIILDGSGSIPTDDFDASLVWAQEIIAYNIPETASVAVMQFSHYNTWIHEFSDTQVPRDDMDSNIAASSRQTGGTNIGSALQVGIAAISQQSATEKIIILLTDGYSSPAVCPMVNPMPADISLYVVGLNGADPSVQSQLGCLNPPAVDIVTIANFDFTVVTDALVACEAICYNDGN